MLEFERYFTIKNEKQKLQLKEMIREFLLHDYKLKK